MAHTKGPWEANPGVLNGNHILVRGGDYAVAKVYNEEAGKEAVNAANARLIAAAPDLLAALERIADGPWPDDIDSPEEHAKWDEQIARTAIARAKGE